MLEAYRVQINLPLSEVVTADTPVGQNRYYHEFSFH
jgi:hypothetical protein